MKSYDCIVVGDVLFDIIAHQDTWTGNFIRDGTTYLDHAEIMPGGSGNVAVGMSLLGLKVAFIGKAGKDPLGRLYKEDLKSNNVTSKIFLDKRLPTGIAIVLNNQKGGRSFLVFRGSNDRLMPEEIESLELLIRSSRYLYVCGCSLVSTGQQNAVLRAVEIAKTYGVKVVFDPGTYNLIIESPRLFKNLLTSSDIFCPNLKEAKTITNTKTLHEAVGSFRNLGHARLVAIKLGECGSILVSDKATVRTKAPKVRLVDSTGAGDAFVAAVVYGLAQELPLGLTARVANWYAAQLVTSYGARSYPAKDQILAFLKKLGSSRYGVN